MNRPPQQLPLALKFSPDQHFDTFAAAPPGVLDQLAALAAGEGTWCLLTGPAGSGKTHLLLAACLQAEAAVRRAGYLSLRDAGDRLGDALDALRDAPFVALDDLDAVAGDRDAEVALFHFHNQAQARAASVLYASATAPMQWPAGLPDWRSRLGQCARIVLAPLDDDGRRQLMRLRAARRGLAFDPAALDWLLARLPRDTVSLSAAFERLDHASLAAQRRLTVPFLREVFA
jgi:DnaA family protein